MSTIELIAQWRERLNIYLYRQHDALTKKRRLEAAYMVEHYQRDLVDLYRALADERFLEVAFRAHWDRDFHRVYHPVYEDELD